MTTGYCFIGGQWREGQGSKLSSLNPADGSEIWTGGAADAADVDAAFQAARGAFPAWARTPLSDRITIIERFGTLLVERKAEIAELISKETGKLLWDSQGEAAAMAGKIGISLKAYEDRTGSSVSQTDFGSAEMTHKPLGVMFVLGPYNFPGHLPNGHIVPALIAGNTCVFKPSELTPAVGELMVRIWEEAGLPAGVLNLVQGARETGAAALDHDQLDGVLFTGSHNTGQFIHKKFAGRTGVQLALEMGGNNPLVVWGTDDVESAARIAAWSAYVTSGQRCSCARRLIVPDDDFGNAMIDRLAEIARNMPVGQGADDAFMGPLISPQAAEQVLHAHAKQVEAGCRAVVEAGRLDAGEAFLSAGLLDATGVNLPDTEVFGPLLKVYRVATFDDAIAAANDTAYGLSAGLVSDDAALWERFKFESRAGIVNFNRPTPGAASSMRFGGPGHSGNLRPSAYYAADYCAWPMASQIAPKPEPIAIKGLS